MGKTHDAAPIIDRFTKKYKINDKTGCWEWTAGLAGAGYGILFLHKKNKKAIFLRAHRFSYEYFYNTKIPEDREIDHICQVKHCVNPKHMRLATRRENMLAGDTIASRNAAKTHCRRGHPFTPENTHITTKGWRNCKACWVYYHATQRQKEERKKNHI